MQREVGSNASLDESGSISVSLSPSLSPCTSPPGLTVTFRLPEPEARNWWNKKGKNASPATHVPESPPRILTISKLMALAIKLDRAGRESQNNYADIARTGGVTRARITQVMNLLNLAPDIQEEILFLPTRTSGSPRITEKQIRPIAGIVDWERQRSLWAKVARPGVGEDSRPMPSVVSVVAGPSLQRLNH